MEQESFAERAQRVVEEGRLRMEQLRSERQLLAGAEPVHLAEPLHEVKPPRLLTRRVSEVQSLPVEWLWRNWLPRGMVTLFAGYGGGGKTTMVLSIAAAVSTGGLLPDGQRAPVGNVLILAAEDSPEHTIKPRLDRLEADTDRITIADGVAGWDQEPQWITLRHHIAQLEAEIINGEISLVIVDPVSSYIGDINADRESEVRAGLLPLIQLAERTQAAILLIRHVTKSSDNPRVASRILGSTAWHDLPRVAWMLADAPEEHQPEPGHEGLREMVRVLGVVKSNIAVKPPARWCVQPINAPLRWLPDPSPVSVEQCFSRQPETNTTTKVQEAEAWLAELLKGGMQRTVDVERAAAESGFSKATMKRARQSLGVKSEKIGYQGEWFLCLPPKGIPDIGVHEDDHAPGVSAFDTFDETDLNHTQELLSQDAGGVVYVHHESEYGEDASLP